MNWQQDGAEHFGGLKGIRFDKRLTTIIYLECRDWHIRVCTHTKYKDEVTFREVSRMSNDSYQFEASAGPLGPGSSVYQIKLSAFQWMRF